MENKHINNDTLQKYLEFLEAKLKESKPGLSAQKEMVPMIGNTPHRTFETSKDAANSAVLLLLTDNENEFEILFTLRSKSLSNHSGQISFPGGGSEGKETLQETALRETYEETGLKPENIHIIGELSALYVPPSNSIVHPFVGYIKNSEVNIKSNPDEVEETFFVPLKHFLDNKNKQTLYWDFDGVKVKVPAWEIHKSTPLWGATAMILNEFLVISKPYFSK